jgi:hypothetical protein
MKERIQLVAAAVSLTALLAYTLVHTGGLLARYIHPAFVGYVAAFGIELSIVGLSLRIGDMRRARHNTGFFVAVLVAVVLVSAVANVAEGFYALQGEVLTVRNVSQLDPVQSVILFLATGLISLIVFALSEIIGTDIGAAIRKAERDAAKVAKVAPALPEVATPLPGVASALPEVATPLPELAPPDGLTQAQGQVWLAIKSNPDATQREIAEMLGISRQAVGQHVAKMNGALK